MKKIFTLAALCASVVGASAQSQPAFKSDRIEIIPGNLCDGKAYIQTRDDNGISILNTNDFKTVTTIPVPTVTINSWQEIAEVTPTGYEKEYSHNSDWVDLQYGQPDITGVTTSEQLQEVFNNYSRRTEVWYGYSPLNWDATNCCLTPGVFADYGIGAGSKIIIEFERQNPEELTEIYYALRITTPQWGKDPEKDDILPQKDMTDVQSPFELELTQEMLNLIYSRMGMCLVGNGLAITHISFTTGEHPYTDYTACKVPGIDIPTISNNYKNPEQFGNKYPENALCIMDGQLMTMYFEWRTTYDVSSAEWARDPDSENSDEQSLILQTDYRDYDSGNFVDAEFNTTMKFFNEDTDWEWIECSMGDVTTVYDEPHESGYNESGTITLRRSAWNRAERTGVSIKNQAGTIATIQVNDAYVDGAYKLGGKIYLRISYSENEKYYNGLFLVEDGTDTRIQEVSRQEVSEGEFRARKLMQEGRVVIQAKDGQLYSTDGKAIK